MCTQRLIVGCIGRQHGVKWQSWFNARLWNEVEKAYKSPLSILSCHMRLDAIFIVPHLFILSHSWHKNSACCRLYKISTGLFWPKRICLSIVCLSTFLFCLLWHIQVFCCVTSGRQVHGCWLFGRIIYPRNVGWSLFTNTARATGVPFIGTCNTELDNKVGFTTEAVQCSIYVTYIQASCHS